MLYNDLRRSFRRIYPEDEVKIIQISGVPKESIFLARFPDGEYYFRVTKNSVSQGFNTFAEAKKTVSW